MFHNVKHHFDKVKNLLGQGYAHGKAFLGRLDNAVNTGKEIYKIIEPALHSLAPQTTSKANKHLTDAASRYDSIKNKVIQAHDTAEHHVNDISSKFKSKNIHIGL
jgi:hypothetical protein